MRFSDDRHEAKYDEFCSRMKRLDEYHTSVAYLLALDVVCRVHPTDLFDFSEDIICPDALNKAWQTSTSCKTTRLMFNLWNGYCSDGETGNDKDGYEVELPSKNYAVDNIFSCTYAPYYFEAIRLRFPIYFDE